MPEFDVPETLPDVEPDETIDNRGRGCANGIAQVQRALTDLPEGAILEIRSTDKRAKEEYPQLTARTPHELLGIESERTGILRTEYTTYLRIHHE